MLYDTDDSVWAYSKDGKGPGYELTQHEYAMLVIQANNARTMAHRAKGFLEMIKPDLDLGNFIGKDGYLTGAGVFVDHFNLAKNLEVVQESTTEAVWRLGKKRKFGFSKIDLQLLYRSVGDVVDMTARGLVGRLTFRGVDQKEVDNKTAGLIRFRVEGAAKGVRAGRPEVVGSTKPKRIPKLDEDPIFTNEKLAAQGAIHINYILLSQTGKKELTYLTILHEATHKFARTIDVDAPNSYSVRDCRKMHWTLAVRNATHHERFFTVASQYSKAIDKGLSMKEHRVYASK